MPACRGSPSLVPCMGDRSHTARNLNFSLDLARNVFMLAKRETD
jgi:hypothetical protein